MTISREKVFETCAGAMLVTVSIYTALRVAKELKSHAMLFSAATSSPEIVSYILLISFLVGQLVSAISLIWPRLQTIRSGKRLALSVLCAAHSLHLVVSFASATGRGRTMALVAASFLQAIRHGSSRLSSHMGMDVEASVCDRVYGKVRDSATRYKGAAVAIVLMICSGASYIYFGQPILFARHQLQREIGIEQAVDVLGSFTLLFTIGSFQQNSSVFAPLDTNEEEPIGRVARAKCALAKAYRVAARTWEDKREKRNIYKDL